MQSPDGRKKLASLASLSFTAWSAHLKGPALLAAGTDDMVSIYKVVSERVRNILRRSLTGCWPGGMLFLWRQAVLASSIGTTRSCRQVKNSYKVLFDVHQILSLSFSALNPACSGEQNLA